MSATAIRPVGRQWPHASGTLRCVLRSEWTKLWSLRSTRWSLLVAFMAMAGIGPAVAAITVADWHSLSIATRLSIDPIDRGLSGFYLAQLPIGVVGVMLMSSEYATGMIQSSLIAVPSRLHVLWAKILVFGSVTFVATLTAALVAFFASQALFAQQHASVALSAPHALRAVFGVALWITASGVLCIALGAIVRRTAGAVAIFVALLFVLPVVTAVFPIHVAGAFQAWLPAAAGTAVATAASTTSALSPWTGFALCCGYMAATVAVAAWLLKRRDA